MDNTSTHLDQLLAHAVATKPEKLAVVIPDEFELTYTQFQNEVSKVKNVLLGAGTYTLCLGSQLTGVHPGDVIGITLGNGLSFLVSFFAVVSIRAIAAPLNPAYKRDDFLFYMEDTQMKANIVHKGTDENEEVVKAAAQLNIGTWEISDSNGSVTLAAPQVCCSFLVITSGRRTLLRSHSSSTGGQGFILTHLWNDIQAKGSAFDS
jgi:acyl-CoA synthetase (AMP-forming)/AMP-acid ligase II